MPVAVGNHVGIFSLQGVHRVLQLADLRQEAVDLRVIVDDRRLLDRRHIFFNGNFHVLRLLAQPLDFRLQCLDLRQHPGIGFRLTLHGQGHPGKGFLVRLERGRLAGRQGRLRKRVSLRPEHHRDKQRTCPAQGGASQKPALSSANLAAPVIGPRLLHLRRQTGGIVLKIRGALGGIVLLALVLFGLARIRFALIRLVLLDLVLFGLALIRLDLIRVVLFALVLFAHGRGSSRLMTVSVAAMRSTQ